MDAVYLLSNCYFPFAHFSFLKIFLLKCDFQRKRTVQLISRYISLSGIQQVKAENVSLGRGKVAQTNLKSPKGGLYCD